MGQRVKVGGWLVGCLALATSCGGGELVPGDASMHDAELDAELDAGSGAVDAQLDGPGSATGGPCNLLTQAGCSIGEKCTWILESLSPQYVGHVGCAPDGTANAGDPCMFGAPGASGYDNCDKGLVCGNYRGGTGTCKTICDQLGGTPMCAASHGCVTYAGLFETSTITPPAGGVCDVACDPLADNDFDGSGTASTKTGTVCNSTPSTGCYGYPSYGTPPVTTWSCTNDINFDESQPTGLRHRVQCTELNNCADAGPTIYVNSCNQGYLPLLYEATGVTTIICVAMCKPATCYSGNCGVGDTNRQGDPTSAHECSSGDRVGSFAVTEHCQYLWWREVDDAGNHLASTTSDSVGFCMDFAKYRYDSNGDNQVNTNDLPLPNCDTLGSGYGTGSNPAIPTTFFGAADLGCVPSTYLPPAATGKQTLPVTTLRKRALTDLPRALFRRTIRD
jgi:hypothetical protein